jgi:hypothetical protein
VGSLPPGDVETRFRVWRRRVGGAQPQVELLDLYQGEAWQEVRGLYHDAKRVGFSVRTMVASAGLGLRDVSTESPAYAATFAGGHPDSVGSNADQNRDWWGRLRDLKASESLTADVGDRVLLVLSESYARAMDRDLVELAGRGGDLLLVGGWRTIDGLPRLPADRSLRAEFGGTASSVSIRMARRWLSRRTGRELYNARDASAWSWWARSVARTENYQRTPVTDTQILGLIGDLRADEQELSATRALRSVRDAGIACEQKRFARLFHTDVGTQ